MLDIEGDVSFVFWGKGTISWCSNTDPKIAHPGLLYVRQARERDIPVKTFTILCGRP